MHAISQRRHVRPHAGDIEDGIPSAHVSGSVLLLFYGIEAAAAAGWLSSSGGGGGGADPGLLLALQLAAAAWVAWVAWGRLYLGLHRWVHGGMLCAEMLACCALEGARAARSASYTAHRLGRCWHPGCSPADLAAGGLLGWLLLALWRELEAPYTAWLESGAGGLPQQLQVLTAAAALMRCYPMATRRRTSCYEHATCWCGGWTGVTLGYLHMRARGMHGAAADTAAAAQQQLMPWRMQLPLMAAKVAVGLLVMVATKVAVKQACLALLPHAFSCVPTWVRCLWQPPVAGMPPREAAAGAAAGGSAAAKLQQGAKAPRSRRGGGDDSRGSSDGVPQHDQDGDGSAARCSSSDGPHASSSGGSSWVLRHGPSGTANDVEAASRFASWAVMCFAILTLDAWWQRLVRQLAFSTSLA